MGFGIQRSKDDMLSILAESTTIFVRSLGVFAIVGIVNREIGIIIRCVLIISR
jgi:hypothetical protein